MNVTTENTDTPHNVVPLRRQQSLPGIGRDIPVVEEAAIRLRDKRAQWRVAQEESMELEQELLAVMEENEVEIFEFDEDGEPYVAKVKVGKKKVSVKKKKKPAIDNSEDA